MKNTSMVWVRIFSGTYIYNVKTSQCAKHKCGLFLQEEDGTGLVMCFTEKSLTSLKLLSDGLRRVKGKEAIPKPPGGSRRLQRQNSGL